MFYYNTIICQKSEEEKLIVVNYYNNRNDTYQYVCDKFNLPLRSLKRWVKEYKNNGTLKRKTRICNPYKVTDKQVEFIYTKLYNNVCIKSLHEEMKRVFTGYCPSYTYVSLFIKKNEKPKDEKTVQKLNGKFVLTF